MKPKIIERISLMRFISATGQPVPENKRVLADHHMLTVTVTVRSMDAISTERLKQLIQTRLEVVNIQEVDKVCVVMGMDEAKIHPHAQPGDTVPY
jgi:hypothetical protein